MKKLLLFLLAALVIGGMVWAQGVPVNDAPDTTGGHQGGPLDRSLSGVDGKGLFDRASSVPTISTEARYSAGIFGSMVDDYIGVNSYDPNIGTFMFLGGYPSNGLGVNTTDVLTSANDNDKYALSLGFGKSFRAFYLGVYYGGGLVDASGDFTAGNKDLDIKDSTNSKTVWKNDMALLVGTGKIGAFRLDFSLNTDTEKDRYNKNVMGKIREDGPKFALTWGGIKLAGMDPYVSIGFKFPDKYIWGDYNMENKYVQAKGTENAVFGIQAGVNYDLRNNSSISGDLVLMSRLGGKLSGDRYIGDDIFNFALDGSGKNFSVKTGGHTIFGFRFAYKQTLEFGKFAFGYKPNLALAYGSNKTNVYSGDFKAENPSNNAFELATGIDLGLRLQASRVFAFYTGAGLTFFDWRTYSHSGGKPKNNDTSWSFDGISWNGGRFAGDYLGFGMTITPVQNVVIGCGLNTIIDRFFIVNLAQMQIESGYFFDDNGEDNVGSWSGGLFRNLKFDLTISFKF